MPIIIVDFSIPSSYLYPIFPYNVILLENKLPTTKKANSNKIVREHLIRERSVS